MASIEKEEGFKVAPLEGSSNYRTWKFSMKMVLMAKELWSIVDGTESKPGGETSSTTWEKRAQRALAIISLSLTPMEQQHIIDCTSPKEAWDILVKLYEGKGRNRKFMLLAELFGLRMNDLGEMSNFLHAAKEKISELATTSNKIDDDIKLGIILNGLPEYYRYLVVPLDRQTTIDFDELSARLMEEEKLRSHQEGTTALKANARRSHAQLRCHYCGELGHVQNECKVKECRKKKYGDNEQETGHVARSAQVAF